MKPQNKKTPTTDNTLCYVDIFGLHLQYQYCVLAKTRKDRIKMSKFGQIFLLARIKL